MPKPVHKIPLEALTGADLKEMLRAALEVNTSSRHALDRELEEHSKRHAEWAILSARAKKNAGIAEKNLKKVTAEVARSIRQENPGLPKTAPVFKEMVPTDGRWNSAYEEYLAAQEHADILESVNRTFNNRAWILIQLSKSMDQREPTYKKRKQRDDDKTFDMEGYDLDL